MKRKSLQDTLTGAWIGLISIFAIITITFLIHFGIVPDEIKINWNWKKEQVKIEVPQIDSLTMEKFATDAAKAADNKKGSFEMFPFYLKENETLKGSNDSIAWVAPFPLIWERDSLSVINEIFPLTINFILPDGTSYTVMNPEHLLWGFESGNKFKIPGPKYLVFVGEKFFLINQNLELWRTHEEVRLDKKK